MQYKKHIHKGAVLLALVGMNTAHAAPPRGCYSPHAAPNSCWNTTIAQSHFGSLDENVDWYGFTVGHLVWDYKIARDAISSCASFSEDQASQLNSFSSLTTRLQRQVRRLKLKCGSKCR